MSALSTVASGTVGWRLSLEPIFDDEWWIGSSTSRVYYVTGRKAQGTITNCIPTTTQISVKYLNWENVRPLLAMFLLQFMLVSACNNNNIGNYYLISM
mmetsp:Transcript_944/g.1232  ORF Transcript_944/g.1232 Transcript_944/m.1232 type:complete len:98 (-) Transcript_944:46-339(-)